MILEICYSFKQNKDSVPQISWTYYHAESDDLAKAIGQAGKYFTKFKRENGWNKEATLKEIRLIPNQHEKANVVRVNPDVKSSKPKSSTSRPRKSQRTSS
jgi:hypothetical protein